MGWFLGEEWHDWCFNIAALAALLKNRLDGIYSNKSSNIRKSVGNEKKGTGLERESWGTLD